MDIIYIKELRKPSDDQFNFHLSNGEILKYKKTASSEDRYYLTNPSGPNHLLFDKLGFVYDEKNKFVSEIVGYDAQYAWPEVKSEEDLMKVINALCEYNNPEYHLKADFIVEDYPVLPSEVRSFYSNDKKDVTFKELNVTYELYPTTSGIWWSPIDKTEGKRESYIFTQLKIKDKNKWVEKILSYRPCGGTGELAFPKAKTKEDAYKVMDALIAEYIKQFKLKTKVNYGDSKIELRRKKADVRVGSCPAGSIVYGKRSKTSIRSGRVSYKACIGY